MAQKNLDNWTTWNRPPKLAEEPVRAELLMTKQSRGRRNGYDAYDYAIVFSDPKDLVDAVVNNVKKGAWTDNIGRNETTTFKFGTDPECQSQEQLCQLMLEGRATKRQTNVFNEEMQRLMQNFPELEKLKEVGVQMKRRRVWVEDGDELDIDRYMNGDVEQWAKMRRVDGVQRTCTIVYESATGHQNKADSFVKSMAVLAALADITEASGIATEIVIAFTSWNRGDHELHKALAIKIKNFGEPIDTQKMMSLSSASVFRSLFFTIVENMAVSNLPNRAVGSPIDISVKRKIYGEMWGADLHVQGSDEFTKDHSIRMFIEDVAKVIGIRGQD